MPHISNIRAQYLWPILTLFIKDRSEPKACLWTNSDWLVCRKWRCRSNTFCMIGLPPSRNWSWSWEYITITFLINAYKFKLIIWYHYQVTEIRKTTLKQTYSGNTHLMSGNDWLNIGVFRRLGHSGLIHDHDRVIPHLSTLMYSYIYCRGPIHLRKGAMGRISFAIQQKTMRKWSSETIATWEIILQL